MWVFYIELATDFLKLTTYLVFFTIIITFYGLPLNIVRDVYITARSFITRLRALHRYQTATRNMDQRYPNATADELATMSDRTCIICREEMVLHEAGQAPASSDGPNTTPKKLPCGHIFHFHCLRSWLERQQSCPTCRRTVLDPHPQGTEPAAPAPAAAAVPPGQAERLNMPAVVQNQQNARVNNPLGNPLGLMGRLFGPPAQPPIIPGQLPAAQPQQNQNQNHAAQAPGTLAGQLPQGVVIQYHIQYQLPRNQQQNTQQPALQPLQPPPQFTGFPGPGGAWQVWPQNGVAGPGPQPPNPPSTPPAPTPTVIPQTQQPPTTSIASATGASNREDDSSATPRQAAALAALRRLNSTNNRPSGGTTSQPAELAASSQARSTEGTSSAPPQDTTSDAQPSGNLCKPPPLIPLYDFSALGSGFAAAPSANGVTQPSSSAGSGEPQGRGLGGARVSSRTIPRPTQGTQQPSGQRNTSSLLPPTLTDEQLAVMDRLTRDAIDERLRVLEGVSSAVYRCIDDLMRMRSTLPSPTPAVPQQSTTSTTAVNPEPSGSGEGPISSRTVSAKDPQISERPPTSGVNGVEDRELDVLTNVPGGEIEQS
ncbi:putative RING-H2 zinc finger domain containing protein [Lyophyllum shimeji]|uniref:RING-type E3 ubiquitin transferase n=1 Tax=Lyophyllum shimeji TaxID=47721 RepID=A0A9P3UL36_LYOSH|nr:putative RING-H2 zinc finger domain containing protein [Lyophyllum shimeji]